MFSRLSSSDWFWLFDTRLFFLFDLVTHRKTQGSAHQRQWQHQEGPQDFGRGKRFGGQDGTSITGWKEEKGEWWGWKWVEQHETRCSGLLRVCFVSQASVWEIFCSAGQTRIINCRLPTSWTSSVFSWKATCRKTDERLSTTVLKWTKSIKWRSLIVFFLFFFFFYLY